MLDGLCEWDGVGERCRGGGYRERLLWLMFVFFMCGERSWQAEGTRWGGGVGRDGAAVTRGSTTEDYHQFHIGNQLSVREVDGHFYAIGISRSFYHSVYLCAS